MAGRNTGAFFIMAGTQPTILFIKFIESSSFSTEGSVSFITRIWTLTFWFCLKYLRSCIFFLNLQSGAQVFTVVDVCFFELEYDYSKRTSRAWNQDLLAEPCSRGALWTGIMSGRMQGNSSSVISWEDRGQRILINKVAAMLRGSTPNGTLERYQDTSRGDFHFFIILHQRNSAAPSGGLAGIVSHILAYRNGKLKLSMWKPVTRGRLPEALRGGWGIKRPSFLHAGGGGVVKYKDKVRETSGIILLYASWRSVSEVLVPGGGGGVYHAANPRNDDEWCGVTAHGIRQGTKKAPLSASIDFIHHLGTPGEAPAEGGAPWGHTSHRGGCVARPLSTPWQHNFPAEPKNTPNVSRAVLFIPLVVSGVFTLRPWR